MARVEDMLDAHLALGIVQYIGMVIAFLSRIVTTHTNFNITAGALTNVPAV